MQQTVSFAANTRDVSEGHVTLPHPQTQFLTVDDMKQADCIETLASDEDHCL